MSHNACGCISSWSWEALAETSDQQGLNFEIVFPIAGKRTPGAAVNQLLQIEESPYDETVIDDVCTAGEVLKEATSCKADRGDLASQRQMEPDMCRASSVTKAEQLASRQPGEQAG